MNARQRSRLQALEGQRLAEPKFKPPMRRLSIDELDAELARIEAESRAYDELKRAEHGDGYQDWLAEESRLAAIDEEELRQVEILPEWLEWGFDTDQLTPIQLRAFLNYWADSIITGPD